MQSQDANAAFFDLMYLECDNRADKARRVRVMLEENRKHLPGTVPFDINHRNYGLSALRLAISDSNTELVRILLDYGADCNLVTTDEENREPLLHCAMRSHSGSGSRGLTMMILLLDRGVSACDITRSGTTLLHIACSSTARGREERFMLLYDKIPQIQLPRLLSSRSGRNKQTPLHMFVDRINYNFFTNYESTINIFRKLVELGSGLEVRCGRGYTAMGMCVRCMNDDELAPGPLILELLLKHGAKTETHVNDRGWTALHEAVDRHKPWAVEMLLNAGANAHALTDNGISPLVMAQCQPANSKALLCFQEFEAKQDEKLIAYAMTHHKRLGENSRGIDMEQGVIDIILKFVRSDRENL
jgi:ankyrin repeat protein